MGVNDLWSILSPVQESVPLYSLTGKTLAVDLSLWVCEAQHVQGMMGKVTKPHLRYEHIVFVFAEPRSAEFESKLIYLVPFPKRHS